MGGSKKKARIPAAQSPRPEPVQLDVEALEKQRAKRKQKLRQFGREGTILTTSGLGGDEAKSGTLLGGTA